MPPGQTTATTGATATRSSTCCGTGGCSGNCQSGGGSCGGGGGGSCGGGSCGGNKLVENTRMASQVMAGVMSGVGGRVAVAAYGVAPGSDVSAGKGGSSAGGGGCSSGGRSGGGRGGCGSCDDPVSGGAGPEDVSGGSSPGADAAEFVETQNTEEGRDVGSNAAGACSTPGVVSTSSLPVADLPGSLSTSGSIHTSSQSSSSGTAVNASDSAEARSHVGLPVKSSRGLPLEIQYED